MSQPQEYPRRILLMVSGLAPQIITETVYALAVSEKVPYIPTEIHLITTSEGADRARLMLLGDKPGWFKRLLREYDLPVIDFTEEHIHVIHGSHTNEISDIRSIDDNRCAADYITAKVRTLTSDPNSSLHVSLAGGRKTMGFYAGYALSLFGRQQDRLSHVLVAAPYEGNAGFFFPTKENDVITTPHPDNRPLDTSKAEVSLAYIPFVRLRHGLPELLLQGDASFSETVAHIQGAMGTPSIHIDFEYRTVRCADKLIDMEPADFAFYSWMVLRRVEGKPPVHWTDTDLATEYLQHYAFVVGEHSGAMERVEESLKKGFTKEFWDPRKSNTHSKLREALGKQLSRVYEINASGKHPRKRFGLTLSPDVITIKKWTK